MDRRRWKFWCLVLSLISTLPGEHLISINPCPSNAANKSGLLMIMEESMGHWDLQKVGFLCCPNGGGIPFLVARCTTYGLNGMLLRWNNSNGCVSQLCREGTAWFGHSQNFSVQYNCHVKINTSSLPSILFNTLYSPTNQLSAYIQHSIF